jgi:hypothetical protein
MLTTILWSFDHISTEKGSAPRQPFEAAAPSVRASAK